MFERQKSIHNKTHSSISKHFGQYEEFKLTKYLTGNSSVEDSEFALLRDKLKGEIIPLVKIHPESLVL